MGEYKNLKSDAKGFIPNLRKKLGLGESADAQASADEDERKKKEAEEERKRRMTAQERGFK
jgi:hypothetical protein